MNEEYTLSVEIDEPILSVSEDEASLSLDDGIYQMSVDDNAVSGQAHEEIIVNKVASDPYTGDYTFTPTEDTQTIPIYMKTATENITINPIPTNYGLITWNGTTITVS